MILDDVVYLLLKYCPRSSSVAALGPDWQEVGEELIFPLVSLEKSSRPGMSHGWKGSDC